MWDGHICFSQRYLLLYTYMCVYIYEKDNLWGGWDNLGYRSYKDKENNNGIALLRNNLKKPKQVL